LAFIPPFILKIKELTGQRQYKKKQKKELPSVFQTKGDISDLKVRLQE
jgi:hypothetical protein